MHSSRMRTARLLTVSQHALPGAGGVYLPSGAGGVPARGVYLPGGVPAREGVYCLGVYLPEEGDVPARGVYLPGGVPAREGVYLPGGVPARGGGCTCRGVYLSGGGGGLYLPRVVLRLRAVTMT